VSQLIGQMALSRIPSGQFPNLTFICGVRCDGALLALRAPRLRIYHPALQSGINVCATRCSGGLRPPSSIGDRRYNPRRSEIDATIPAIGNRRRQRSLADR